MRTVDEIIPGLVQRTTTAMEAFQAGRFAEAAPTLQLAAETAVQIGDVMQTNIFGSCAVVGYVKAGDPQAAIRLVMHFVALHQTAGRTAEAARFGRLSLKPLRRDGHVVEADEISTQLARVLGAAWNDPDAPRLPAFCSNCGAAVKPAEVVRPTPSTVACQYCGGSLDRR
jgi:hypothetical protein